MSKCKSYININNKVKIFDYDRSQRNNNNRTCCTFYCEKDKNTYILDSFTIQCHKEYVCQYECNTECKQIQISNECESCIKNYTNSTYTIRDNTMSFIKRLNDSINKK